MKNNFNDVGWPSLSSPIFLSIEDCPLSDLQLVPATTKSKMYSKTYPALTPEASRSARKQLLHVVVPTITAGTLIADDALLLAMEERITRETLSKSEPGGVTQSEVFATMIREHAIMVEHTEPEYPKAITPTVMS
ncbi:hypothetical protein ON010_g5119 [Phytophthora cinnamomi]|nr:hypothetical protein ON010_g5119 [Phytophthora cinnamomi]